PQLYILNIYCRFRYSLNRTPNYLFLLPTRRSSDLLICVGATLSVNGLASAARVMSWMIAVRLFAMPCVALLIGWLLPLSPLERQMLLLFSALPTASTAYILAVRMGG